MRDLLNLYNRQRQPLDFDAIRIGLAPPDLIRSLVIRRGEEAGND